MAGQPASSNEETTPDHQNDHSPDTGWTTDNHTERARAPPGGAQCGPVLDDSRSETSQPAAITAAAAGEITKSDLAQRSERSVRF